MTSRRVLPEDIERSNEEIDLWIRSNVGRQVTRDEMIAFSGMSCADFRKTEREAITKVRIKFLALGIWL